MLRLRGPRRAAGAARVEMSANSAGPSVRNAGAAAWSSTAAAAKVPSVRVAVATSTLVPWEAAPCLSRIQAAAGDAQRAVEIAQIERDHPEPAGRHHEVCRFQGLASGRTGSRAGPAARTPQAAAARASRVAAGIDQRGRFPGGDGLGQRSKQTAVRPDERRPEISLSAARGHPPASSSSSAPSPVLRRPRACSSRSIGTIRATSSGASARARRREATSIEAN